MGDRSSFIVRPATAKDIKQKNTVFTAKYVSILTIPDIYNPPVITAEIYYNSIINAPIAWSGVSADNGMYIGCFATIEYSNTGAFACLVDININNPSLRGKHVKFYEYLVNTSKKQFREFFFKNGKSLSLQFLP